MISPDTIALVKERTDIVALVAETVKLTRRGRNFVGLCPFHQEKSPSFNVNTERGLFYCFGCHEHGSAVDFVMKVEGSSFPEAIRSLAERAGVEVAETSTDAERREAAAARKSKDDLYAVNGAAATFFERSLRGRAVHPLAHHAQEELARRGLPLPEEDSAIGEAARIGDTLQAFRIGYAPFGWDGLATYLKQQGISPVQAAAVGLLVPRTSGSGYYDRFRHRLMFAVSDVQGRVIAFSGRALPEPPPEELAALKIPAPTTTPDAAPAKYMNSPESPIYTKGEHLFGLLQARQAIRQQGEAVIVEGNFDVVSLHARGVTNVVAPLGTAFTPAQAKLVKRFAPTVIVLFDGDAAGRKATRAARGPCREGGLDAKVAVLPKGIDPDDLVRKQGVAALERILKAARGMLGYLIEEALDSEAFRSGSLEDQRARIRAVAQILSEESDPNLRAMAKTYADQLSSKLILRGQAPASLRELEVTLEQAVSGGARPKPPAAAQSAEPHERARSRARYDEIALEILGALLDYPVLSDDPEVAEALAILEGDVAMAIYALRRTLAQHSASGSRLQHSASGSLAPHAITGPSQGAHGVADGGAPDDRSAHPSVEIGVYADEFLAQIPALIHSFAVGRLASPAFDSVDVARGVLFDNARKLSSLSLKRENAAEIEELHRVEAQGDVEAQNEMMRAFNERARKKHGLR